MPDKWQLTPQQKYSTAYTNMHWQLRWHAIGVSALFYFEYYMYTRAGCGCGTSLSATGSQLLCGVLCSLKAPSKLLSIDDSVKAQTAEPRIPPLHRHRHHIRYRNSRDKTAINWVDYRGKQSTSDLQTISLRFIQAYTARCISNVNGVGGPWARSGAGLSQAARQAMQSSSSSSSRSQLGQSRRSSVHHGPAVWPVSKRLAGTNPVSLWSWSVRRVRGRPGRRLQSQVNQSMYCLKMRLWMS